jgi:hypothetical protein
MTTVVPPLPDWCRNGREVFEVTVNGSQVIVVPTVVRRTDDQHIVVAGHYGKRVYSRATMRQTRKAPGEGPELTPPDHPVVLAWQDRERVKAALDPVVAVVHELAGQSRRYGHSRGEAIEYARRLRDVAATAYTRLTEGDR